MESISQPGHHVNERIEQEKQYQALGRKIYKALDLKLGNNKTGYLIDQEGKRVYYVQTLTAIVSSVKVSVLEVHTLGGIKDDGIDIYAYGKISDASENLDGRSTVPPRTKEELTQFIQEIETLALDMTGEQTILANESRLEPHSPENPRKQTSD